MSGRPFELALGTISSNIVRELREQGFDVEPDSKLELELNRLQRAAVAVACLGLAELMEHDEVVRVRARIRDAVGKLLNH